MRPPWGWTSAGSECCVMRARWVTGLILMFIERKNQVVQRHARQSVVIFGGLSILGWLASALGSLLGNFPLIGSSSASASVCWAGSSAGDLRRVDRPDADGVLQPKDAFRRAALGAHPLAECRPAFRFTGKSVVTESMNPTRASTGATIPCSVGALWSAGH